MKNNGKIIIKVVICLVLLVGIYFEARTLIKDIHKISEERIRVVIDKSKEIAKTNVSIEPSIHVYEEITYPNKDSDVVAVYDNKIQISGRTSGIQAENEEVINYADYAGEARKLYFHKDYGSDTASSVDDIFAAYFNHDASQLLGLLPEKIKPDEGVCQYYQQTTDNGCVPIILFPHQVSVSGNTTEKYYYHMFLPDVDGYILIYAEDPFILTDKPVTAHIGKVTDRPMTSHTMSIYEAGAVDNTRLSNSDGEPINFTELKYPVYGNYDAAADQKNRDDLLQYNTKSFDNTGVADDGTTIDTHSEAAKNAQISVRKDEATSIYLADNNLKIESIAFSNAVDNTAYNAKLTLGNTVSEPHGFVVGVYILDDSRNLLGVKVYDHTGDPIPADGQITFDIVIDDTVVSDPTKVHYLQFDLR